MKDWEVNPEHYLTDEEGNFKLKADGTPRRKGGRPKGSKGRGYTYHSETKAKRAAKKSVREKQKKLKAAQRKVDNYKKSISNTKKTLSKLENENETKLVSASELDDIPSALQAEAQEDVIFKANEGPQEDFLAAGETDVLYGGAAGGGKSYAMIVDPDRKSVV